MRLSRLIQQYKDDSASPYADLSFAVRTRRARLLTRIVREHGNVALPTIRVRALVSWHREWQGDDKVAIAHALISRLRDVFRFGAIFLEDAECARLLAALREMRFEKPKPRLTTMLADHAIAIRKSAHERGWPYLALAQSLQFDLRLNAKQVIGEWVPMSEPGDSDVVMQHPREKQKKKWIRGLRWEDIDQDLVLHRTGSSGQRQREVNLKSMPMVLQELATLVRVSPAAITRADLPKTGPVILCEINAWPYTSAEYRRKWRKVANQAGLPKHIQNSDNSRTDEKNALRRNTPRHAFDF
ncbi:hypothetical protein V1292_001935 [Bradyrhizobium sp. AZCC 1719]|uniref:hypothetical protein n=1 Tax=Bradyrhizobium sp. AZCC 1719 TaxID=3117028 RepID=UPI002FEF15D4